VEETKGGWRRSLIGRPGPKNRWYSKRRQIAERRFSADRSIRQKLRNRPEAPRHLDVGFFAPHRGGPFRRRGFATRPKQLVGDPAAHRHYLLPKRRHDVRPQSIIADRRIRRLFEERRQSFGTVRPCNLLIPTVYDSGDSLWGVKISVTYSRGYCQK
jgi:hypothetical protein